MPIYDGDGRKGNIMKRKKLTPEQKEEAKVYNDNTDLFSFIHKKVEEVQGDTTAWMEKQAKSNRIRMRIKKPKTFPFVGSSNLRMPTAEIKIKKLKAAIINVIFGMRPVVQAIPTPSGTFETAQKIEKWLDHIIIDKMKFKEDAIMIVDQALESGFFLAKPFWRYEVNNRKEVYKLEYLDENDIRAIYDGNTTIEMVVSWLVNRFDVDMSDSVVDENYEELEKVAKKVLSADDKIQFYVKDVLCNYPDVSLISPEKVYIPSTTGVDPQSAQWICHEYEMSIDEIERCASYKGWDIEGVNGIKSYANYDTRNMRDIQLDLKEGIDSLNGPDNLVKIWEWYGWMDINGDGTKEKCCITSAPDFKKVLRKVGLPFDNGKWPFVKFYYELTTNRWYSHRGVVEIAEDLIKEIDIQHNMKIDSQTSRNAPMFLYRAGMVNPNLVSMTPNQAIPVRGNMPLNDTISVLNAHNPNVEYSYEREQMLLEAKVEELIGQIDYTLQSMINKRQPRTLGEVEMQQQSANSIFSLDSDMFREQFGTLFEFIWDLWCQYGDNMAEFMYFGENGWEPIRLSKEEIQGKYRFIVRGNDQNSNPNVKIQKAQQVIQAITNPVLLQSGIITPIQQINGLKRFFQTLEIDGWEQFINMQPQPPQPPPVATFIKPKFESLTEGEQAQILQGIGVQPDIPGRMINRQTELQDKAVEILEKYDNATNSR